MRGIPGKYPEGFLLRHTFLASKMSDTTPIKTVRMVVNADMTGFAVLLLAVFLFVSKDENANSDEGLTARSFVADQAAWGSQGTGGLLTNLTAGVNSMLAPAEMRE